jgi:hypothetical protein
MKQNRVLKIDGEYCDFQTFYEKNKKIIYDSIFEIFNEFILNNEQKQFVLLLSTNIDEDCWDTELCFKSNDHIILKRDLMPFYEEIEDYEMCGKIIELDKHFTSIS